jgi:hypothetical protein
MTAKDGPHYANNVALMGDGDYRLSASFVCRQGKRSARLVAAVLRELDFPLPEQRSRLTATAMRASILMAFRRDPRTVAHRALRSDRLRLGAPAPGPYGVAGSL